jgi:hypothetical protein
MKGDHRVLAGALVFALMLSALALTLLSIPQAEPAMNPVIVRPFDGVNPISPKLLGDVTLLNYHVEEQRVPVNADVVHTNPDGIAMSYSKYDYNYSENHIIWFAGQSYAPIQADLVRYNETSKKFTNVYLNNDFRAYFIADNETHVVTTTIGQTNSTLFLVRKADLSVTSYMIPQQRAAWVSGFDVNGDLWMGSWRPSEANGTILRLHFNYGGPQWTDYDYIASSSDLPTQAITNGIYDNGLWFVKQGSGKLSRFDMANHTITDYLIDSSANKYPNMYLSPGIMGFHSKTIWMAGYGLGRIYRFDLNLSTVRMISVTAVLGRNVLSCAPLLAFNESIFLFSKSYPYAGFIWNTSMPFDSTNVKMISIDNLGIANLYYMGGLLEEVPGYHVYSDCLVSYWMSQYQETVTRFGSSIIEFSLEGI